MNQPFIKEGIVCMKKIISAVIQDSCKVKTCQLRRSYEELDIAEITKDIPKTSPDVDV
jgi:hypothetical protein